MRNRLGCLSVATAIIVAMLIPSAAWCDGYGYFAWGRGWPSTGVPGFLAEQVAPEYQDVKVDLMYDHFAIGYLYDGAPRSENRFAWRFSFGFDLAVASLEGTNAPDIITFGFEDLADSMYDAMGYGLETTLTYGIGIIQTKRLRFWAGPSVRLNANYLVQKSAAVEESGLSVEIDPWGISLAAGGGIETGVLYDWGSQVSINASTGFLYNFFAIYQDARMKFEGENLTSDSFMMGQEPFVFVRIALGFGNNPAYSMAPP